MVSDFDLWTGQQVIKNDQNTFYAYKADTLFKACKFEQYLRDKIK